MLMITCWHWYLTVLFCRLHRADEAQGAAGSTRLVERRHRRSRPQTWGRSTGQSPLHRDKLFYFFFPIRVSKLNKTEVLTLSEQNLRQLRLDLQKLGADLQSGERACCRNTGGERLRQALNAADDTLAKQVQAHWWHDNNYFIDLLSCEVLHLLCCGSSNTQIVNKTQQV